ncbi:factor VIII intron 22 protein-like [Sitophilus oryzae]|uniref:Factor VIII intron 22 protein-like n=1 Tax=Sitophilus oryzae TaxID=7048 RepID=A0A6J2X2I8_SITOR|nr:factor VIII intron 22 protein-like [Sitophilus oryzae]
MSIESHSHHILDQYRSISNKLKKRFLRKTNETEGAESFAGLAQCCESQDLHSYAAMGWTAAARCEGALGNTIRETSYLLRAGRQFLQSEESDFKTGCISVPTENLQAGLSSYIHACTRYPEDSVIPTGLYLELGEFLNRIGHIELTETFLRTAVQVSQQKYDTNIHCLDLLASHFTYTGDYVSALQTYQEMVKILLNLPNNGYRCDVLLKCEVNSVFILLILKPSTQNITPNLVKVLEKYTWGDKSDSVVQACQMSENLFILMQSLVIICQSLDTSSLQHLESEFWRFLSSDQKDLLRILVRLYT